MIKKILILDGHTRQTLPMSKALKKAGHFVTLLCPNKVCMGYVSRWPDRKFICPDAKTHPQDFIQKLTVILKKETYDLVIPHFDYSAKIISENKDILSKYSKLAVNDFNIFMKARDKSETMRLCMENNIPHTKTYYSGENPIPKNILNHIEYPVVIKPVFAESARGFHKIENPDQIESIFDEVVKQYGKTLIQEYIPQTDIQYKCEVFIGNDNEVKAAVVFSKVRWYPVDGGSSTFNLTVSRSDIVNTCTKLLKKMEWKGYADVDLIQDPRTGVAKVMEINPRITGSVKIAFDAGVNFANMIVDDAFGKKIVPVEYETGIGLRMFHKDILWFIKSSDRFIAKPSWFNFFDGTSSDQIISLSDPLPSIFFTLEGLFKLFKGR
ncbi:carboxylate--amine ligase [Mesohalobacter halotolerans]|uniref:ATP-grasp domain-containing protein n=1 Tax=Mesohalobacter halotolerans TaxID=1883405 RepID=A0A4U5TRS9_9FLAO|nr:ATP-grasp domain-containing protein [Mesohalobacter halotolerans]TKS56980.1 ATP-grasp domain-containing protein [Mesohalobacter halotolerans]